MDIGTVKKYLEALFTAKGIVIPKKQRALFETFIEEEENTIKVNQIIENQNFIIMDWNKRSRRESIISQNMSLPNAMVGKPYSAAFDFEKLNWKDITELRVENLEDTGLTYDIESKTVSGTPTQKGDIHLLLKFRLEDDETFYEKKMTLIVNPDPKSLWQNLPSDKNDAYWKEDNISVHAKMGDKNIVVSSKRGRSHANVGSFREDEAMFFSSEETGWNVVVVSDGAGSAKMSREGSRFACASVLSYFHYQFSQISTQLDDILGEYHSTNKDENSTKNLTSFIYEHFPKAVHDIHKGMAEFAQKEGFQLKDLNATLIFAIFKKYEFGYAIITFGVGDCPIVWMNKTQTEVKLMNKLDVGEFGGGTRFITMPEIFGAKDFYNRFGFTLVDDFSYLFLMTDGIYDPKFVVEANLDKIEKWQEFLRDLGGENEANVAVEFSADNTHIAQQLSDWMDFWSAGNHDDRTLAIIF